MAVDLDRIWIHDAVDPTSFVVAYSDRPDDTRDHAGDVRVYANGRLRTITRAVRRQTISITLVDVTTEEVDLLDSWMGALTMYRDPRGRLLFGSYFSLDVTEYKDGSGFSASFTIAEVTHSIEA